MNNQFTQRVSDIITYSKEEANRLRNSYIGPEHLLLGLIREGEGKAIEILLNLNINYTFQGLSKTTLRYGFYTTYENKPEKKLSQMTYFAMYLHVFR